MEVVVVVLAVLVQKIKKGVLGLVEVRVNI